MILHRFEGIPGFPFSRYFEDINQYIGAQQYWTAVLRHAEGWHEEDWAALPAPPLTEEQRFDGEVLAIGSRRKPKQILLQTKSFEGEVASFLRYNQGISAEESARWGGEATAIPAVTRAEAEAFARNSLSVMAWVEMATVWKPDVTHPEGGEEKPVERLILTSEISERAEPRALRALSLFITEHPAAARVNAEFAPEDMA